MTARSLLLVLTCLVPLQAAAEPFQPGFSLPVTGAVAQPAAYDSYDLPVARWNDSGLPVETYEGQVDRRAWQLDSAGASLLEVLAPLRDQLVAQGYEIALDCVARDCGGFDFRFATEILPEPGMHVDLNEFRFLSARRGKEAASIMVSRSASAAFVQIITIGETALPVPTERGGDAVVPPPVPVTVPITEAPAVPVTTPASVAQLDAGLPFALDDLVFETGSAALSNGNYGSLEAVAGWLDADATRRIILVGHTDLSGALEANIALSKRRAEAVRKALIEGFGIAPARISAEGAGPLAPRANNATEEGRQKNRRVEAIPAPT